MTKTEAEPKAELVAGSKVTAIIPRSLEETFRLAGAIHASGLAPATLKGPEQIMVAILAGAELGLAPFQALQSFAVINGRPAIWGDGLMALVRAHGFKVREWAEGTGESLAAHCEVVRPDNGEISERTFTVAQAKKAGLWGKAGPWTQYPERMLQMRARAFALRDAAADVLRGFQVREEIDDYSVVRDVTPKPAGVRARLSGKKADTPGFDPNTAERTLALPKPPEEVEAVLEAAEPQPSKTEATPPNDIDATIAQERAVEAADDDYADLLENQIVDALAPEDALATFNAAIKTKEWLDLRAAAPKRAEQVKARAMKRKAEMATA